MVGPGDAIHGQAVEVWLYDDRLEVLSPGGPPPEVSSMSSGSAGPPMPAAIHGSPACSPNSA